METDIPIGAIIPPIPLSIKKHNHEKDSITIGFMPQYKYCSRAGVQGMGEA